MKIYSNNEPMFDDWVETNKIIVSENSLDNDIRCINVNYENIVDTIIKIINNN